MTQISFGGMTFGKMPIVKSVQSPLFFIENGVTTDVLTINSINTNNTMLTYLGLSQQSDSSLSWDKMASRIEITNATTITATRNSTGYYTSVQCSVIEFHDGILKSNQSGTITMGVGESTDTDTINSVNTSKSICIYRGYTTDSTITTLELVKYVMPRVKLTNATTVTANRYSASSPEVTIGYQVVEFY